MTATSAVFRLSTLDQLKALMDEFKRLKSGLVSEEPQPKARSRLGRWLWRAVQAGAVALTIAALLGAGLPGWLVLAVDVVTLLGSLFDI